MEKGDKVIASVDIEDTLPNRFGGEIFHIKAGSVGDIQDVWKCKYCDKEHLLVTFSGLNPTPTINVSADQVKPFTLQ